MAQPGQGRAALILLRELGLVRALRVGLSLARRQRAGEPFAALPPPENDAERLSRAQIGPAILLYQELLRFLPRDEALRLTERVVVVGAVAFLRRSIGRLRRAELAALDEPGRQRFVEARGARFFNATTRWDEVSAASVRFTVTHCRFPPLCQALGVPELAPVFCKGDERFFGSVEPDVVLERPHTLAEGAASCPFTLRFRDGA